MHFASKSQQRRLTHTLRDLRDLYIEHARDAVAKGYSVRAEHLVTSARLANRKLVRAKKGGL